MSNNSKILTSEQELALRQPIDETVGKIQEEIDNLRLNGTHKVIEISEMIDAVKRDKIYSKQEKEKRLTELKNELAKAKKVEASNKQAVNDNIKKAVSYINVHFDKDYLNVVKQSCKEAKVVAKANYDKKVADLKAEHSAVLAKLSDAEEIKEEKYIQKNRLFDAKLMYQKELSEIKERQHAAFSHKYHLLDLLRMGSFTLDEVYQQKRENYAYNFNMQDFLLRNGLYIAIAIVFIILCFITPIVKNGLQLLTLNNVLNILQQASPRMFLALGVAGLILLGGTDLSIGRMVGMGMTAATIIMHAGINTGSVFGHIFDFTAVPVPVKIIFALLVCIVLCTVFTTIAGVFTAKFKMHPFISTMSNMLVIFGLVTYSTKGVSFGAIDKSIPKCSHSENR